MGNPQYPHCTRPPGPHVILPRTSSVPSYTLAPHEPTPAPPRQLTATHQLQSKYRHNTTVRLHDNIITTTYSNVQHHNNNNITTTTYDNPSTLEPLARSLRVMLPRTSPVTGGSNLYRLHPSTPRPPTLHLPSQNNPAPPSLHPPCHASRHLLVAQYTPTPQHSTVHLYNYNNITTTLQ